MNLESNYVFDRPAVAEWWADAPALHDGGTAFKQWIQSIPSQATREDRKAAHDAIKRLVVPHHPVAEDLSYICIIRKAPR